MAALDFQGKPFGSPAPVKGLATPRRWRLLRPAPGDRFRSRFRRDDYPFATETLDVADAQQVARCAGIC
jgi:hypothetical protein